MLCAYTGGASHKDALDDFVTGTIRPRQGMIERVSLERVDGDAIEIIVVIRSVGTGGYLSADAFRYRARSLICVASVTGLEKGADPSVPLREKSYPGERPSP